MGMMVKYYTSGTSAAGVLSFNTDDLRGICYRLFIKPPAETVTYDLAITDDNSLVIITTKGIRGTLNDLTVRPMKGIYTVALSNISANGLFKFQAEYEET